MAFQGFTDSDNTEEIEDKFVSLSVQFQEVMKTLSGTVSNPAINHFLSSQTKTEVRLPAIDIKIFNGKIWEWHSFSQLFKALTIDNKGLTDLQRFMYLKSYLRYEPLNLVEDSPIDGKSFAIAMDLLKEQYQSQTSVLNEYFKALFDLKSVSKSSVNQLR